MTELVTSGVVANLELWERSEVLFPSFYPSFLSPLLPFCSLLSPTLPSSPLSGGNNFNDFPENQLSIHFAFTHFAFLYKPAWGNATVHRSPLS